MKNVELAAKIKAQHDAIKAAREQMVAEAQVWAGIECPFKVGAIAETPAGSYRPGIKVRVAQVRGSIGHDGGLSWSIFGRVIKKDGSDGLVPRWFASYEFKARP